jgi:L-ascorbate 6-phosphate lactonase
MIRGMALGLTWLGQHSFVLDDGAGSTLVIDPFTAAHPGRRYASPLTAAAIAGLPGLAVLVTHDHIDHLDPDALGALAPGTPLVVPSGIAERARSVSAATVVPLAIGETAAHGPWTIEALPAMHAVHGQGPYTASDPAAPIFCGFRLSGPGSAWHAGDTLDFPALRDAIAGAAFDVAMVPINGRSPEREAQDIAGNTDEAEALALARHARARVLVPAHWDMFAANPGDPAKVVALADEAGGDPAILIPARGRRVVVG